MLINQVFKNRPTSNTGSFVIVCETAIVATRLVEMTVTRIKGMTNAILATKIVAKTAVIITKVVPTILPLFKLSMVASVSFVLYLEAAPAASPIVSPDHPMMEP